MTWNSKLTLVLTRQLPGPYPDPVSLETHAYAMFAKLPTKTPDPHFADWIVRGLSEPGHAV